MHNMHDMGGPAMDPSRSTFNMFTDTHPHFPICQLTHSTSLISLPRATPWIPGPQMCSLYPLTQKIRQFPLISENVSHQQHNLYSVLELHCLGSYSPLWWRLTIRCTSC